MLRCTVLIRNRSSGGKELIGKRINACEIWILLLLLLEKNRGMRKLAEKKENSELVGTPKLKEH